MCPAQPPGTADRPLREPALLSVEGRSWPVNVHYLEVGNRSNEPPDIPLVSYGDLGIPVNPFDRHPCPTVALEPAGPPVSVPSSFRLPSIFLSVPCPLPQEPTADYVRASVEACLAIHATEGPGDILVFLTGEEARSGGDLGRLG